MANARRESRGGWQRCINPKGSGEGGWGTVTPSWLSTEPRAPFEITSKLIRILLQASLKQIEEVLLHTVEVKLWNLLLQDAAKAKASLDPRRVIWGLHQVWISKLTACLSSASPQGTKPDAAPGAEKDHLRMTRVSYSISGNIRELLVQAKAQASLHQRRSTGSPALLFWPSLAVLLHLYNKLEALSSEVNRGR